MISKHGGIGGGTEWLGENIFRKAERTEDLATTPEEAERRFNEKLAAKSAAVKPAPAPIPVPQPVRREPLVQFVQPQQEKAMAAAATKINRCGLCGQTGHKRTTCPNKEEETTPPVVKHQARAEPPKAPPPSEPEKPKPVAKAPPQRTSGTGHPLPRRRTPDEEAMAAAEAYLTRAMDGTVDITRIRVEQIQKLTETLNKRLSPLEAFRQKLRDEVKRRREVFDTMLMEGKQL